MSDRFFIKHDLQIKEIASSLGLNIVSNDDVDIDNLSFTDIASLKDASSSSLSFIANRKYISELASTNALGIIIDEHLLDYAQHIPIKLIAANPYYEYSKALQLFYKSKLAISYSKEFVAKTAYIDEKSSIGNGCHISHNVVIEENVVIGNNCYIGSGVHIKIGVHIGDDSYVDSNAVIQYATIGKRAIIHPSVSIGQDGFGFAFAKGKHNKLLHIGEVIIGDDVEIGAGTTIDRGSVNNTVIHSGTKIDNLVQLGHNVNIGANSIIVAQVGIAGSSSIGDYVVIGGQAGVAGHLKVGNQVQIAAQSGVVKDVANGAVVGGTPAVPIRDWHRQNVLINKMLEKNKKGNKEDEN